MAESVKITLKMVPNSMGRELMKVAFTWVSHTDGSLTAVSTNDTKHEGRTITDWMKGWDVLFAITNPGATAPTANYNAVFTDEDSCDIFGGELNDLSATVAEQAVPLVGSAYATRPITSALSFDITDNSVNTGLGTAILFLGRE